MIPVVPSRSAINDLLSMLVLLELTNLDMLLSRIVPESYFQLITLILHDGLVGTSDEAW